MEYRIYFLLFLLHRGISSEHLGLHLCHSFDRGCIRRAGTLGHEDDAEGKLYRAYQSVASTVAAEVAAGDYLAALTGIATMGGAVDDFFDRVMVMAEDERVRTNRLALLQEIKGLFRDIADFAKIAA